MGDNFEKLNDEYAKVPFQWKKEINANFKTDESYFQKSFNDFEEEKSISSKVTSEWNKNRTNFPGARSISQFGGHENQITSKSNLDPQSNIFDPQNFSTISF